MNILCTFPGRHGDLLWALPTVRAIAETYDQPVDLLIAGEFGGLTQLLSKQPYLDRVDVDPEWSVANWTPPRTPTGSYDRIYHLGYREWPTRPLPEYIHLLGRLAYEDGDINPLDLRRPWITVPQPQPVDGVVVGFTEAWFELKLGLLISLANQLPGTIFLQVTPPGTRWMREVPHDTAAVAGCDWLLAARIIAGGTLLLADCSALHVLGVALGKPVVVMEPMEARWDDIFYPLGKDGPEVTLVLGNDGRPTFDARAVADLIERRLHARAL